MFKIKEKIADILYWREYWIRNRTWNTLVRIVGTLRFFQEAKKLTSRRLYDEASDKPFQELIDENIAGIFNSVPIKVEEFKEVWLWLVQYSISIYNRNT